MLEILLIYLVSLIILSFLTIIGPNIPSWIKSQKGLIVLVWCLFISMNVFLKEKQIEQQKNDIK